MGEGLGCRQGLWLLVLGARRSPGPTAWLQGSSMAAPVKDKSNTALTHGTICPSLGAQEYNSEAAFAAAVLLSFLALFTLVVRPLIAYCDPVVEGAASCARCHAAATRERTPGCCRFHSLAWLMQAAPPALPIGVAALSADQGPAGEPGQPGDLQMSLRPSWRSSRRLWQGSCDGHAMVAGYRAPRDAAPPRPVPARVCGCPPPLPL